MSAASERKDESHERILDAAARALRRSGCSGVGVADVMREAGLTHGGFYAHFDSREDLLIAALERAGSASNAALATAVERGQRAGESPFVALVSAYLGSKHCRDVEHGCPVAALASELPRRSPSVRRAGEHRIHDLVNTVRSVLPPDVPVSQAPLIAATLVGTLQLARSLRGAQRDALLDTARRSLIERYDTTP